MSEDAPRYGSQCKEITVQLKGNDQFLTYQNVDALDAGLTLAIKDADDKAVARFELRNVKHWYTEPES